MLLFDNPISILPSNTYMYGAIVYDYKYLLQMTKKNFFLFLVQSSAYLPTSHMDKCISH